MTIRLAHMVNLGYVLSVGNSVLIYTLTLFYVHFTVLEELFCLCECSNVIREVCVLLLDPLNAMTWRSVVLFIQICGRYK